MQIVNFHHKVKAVKAIRASEEFPAARGALWRVAAAEGAGAAMLVLLGGLAAQGGLGPGGAAAAAGGVVAALVQCLDHVSGAMFNPAVLVTAVARGRLRGRARPALLLGAQLAGACAGAAALRAVGGAAAVEANVTRVAAALPAPLAALVEALSTLVLCSANCAHWAADGAGDATWPLRVGAVVAAMALVTGGWTGASMNPARSFGPALVACRWDHHWVYWAGPLAGSVGASLLYTVVWPSPAPATPRPTDE